MEEIIKLNMFSETRGDLYVVSSNEEKFLNFSNYYIVNFGIDLSNIDGTFSIIIIRGEIILDGSRFQKGNIIRGVVNSNIRYSDDFISLVMTDSVLNIKPLCGINFKVERIFFVDNMPVGSVRGEHSHSVETEFLYSVKGDFDVVIKDVGEFEGIISEGDTALSLPNAWTSVKSLSEEGILLALLSHKFDASGFSY